jgi:hypothetical protein
VDNYLTRTVDGKEAILFDEEGASQLIIAMRSKYRYKINTKGDKDESPDKNHPWSDVADALQYACLHADNGAAFGAALRSTRKAIKPVQYSYV